MLPAQPHIPQEEQCPVPEEVLGHLYRASKHGLEELVATSRSFHHPGGKARSVRIPHCWRYNGDTMGSPCQRRLTSTLSPS